MPRAGVTSDGVLGNGQDNGGNIQTGIAELLDQLRALDLALEQQVDHHDIRSELPRRLEDLRAIVEDFEQLHLRLHAQQVPDVLTDLWHVLSDEQPDSRRVGHGPTISSLGGGSPPPPRYQDGPFVMGSEWVQVVITGQDLHLESCRLGEKRQVAGVEQAEPIRPGPRLCRPAASISWYTTVRSTGPMAGSC